ncbi:tubulin-like doman-containing protein [Paenibacillus thalictri]|uniref:Tubulin-like doman-containing protein n=1 Tax=Paenibacillus thalictri TaxID=2527873 RepID=A0A4Q9DVE7_9BACL|nr:tubulin-like doman-containing protein [Paenibacillus thalictri]TBL80979.1 hypothetical protein EYB31_02440 [Paenibacillus thalictri]
MKPIIREHIQQLDVQQGGGIVSDKIRVDTIDHPMLVIGLGGTGIDALLRVKYHINRRFKLPEDPVSKKKQEKPNNIEYLAFETNEGDRNKKHNGIGLDTLTEFMLLSNAEIGSVLHNRSLLEPYIKEWLSPELLVTDGMKGASGVRQAGRLLLFTKINQVVQTIERKIRVLTEGTSKKLIVFLLTGISGGTGSGCFLDIAYIIRGLLERQHSNAGGDKVDILGYLFTPDVNLANKSLTEHTREYIKKNGYAALKELDYWMNADERGERFRQQYGPNLKVNLRMAPFDYAHLVSATNLDGKLLENSYEYCMNVTAENITNFMASEDKVSGQEFAIHDYMSNISTNIKQMNRPFAANFLYNILGASSAVFPIEEMTTYLAYKVFRHMETMFDKAPSQDDIDKLANRMGFDPDSVHREMNRRIPDRPLEGYQHSERLGYQNVIKTQAVNLDTELEQNFLSRAREEYIKTRKQLPGEVYERAAEALKKIFINPGQGPFYASRLLFSDKGYCLLKQIQAYIESLKESLYRLPRDLEAAKELSLQRLGDARKALISKSTKKDAYIEAKISEFLLHADRERMNQMIEFYEELYTLINQENSRIYEVFTELLNELNSIFQKNADILINGQEEVDHKGNKTYYWNVVSVPDVEKLVSQVIDEKNVDQLIRDFTEALMSRSNRWVREQEVDVVGSISEFLSEHFGGLITKTMEEYLAIKYGNDEALDKLVERRIANRLHEEAKPVFHLDNSMGNYSFPAVGFVSVPNDAPNIYKGINNFKDLSVSNASFTIKESQVKNRIFWLNTHNGIPLYLYRPLKNYEISYENSILEPEGVGRHLVQTDKLSWTNLPSPIPEKSWGETYRNERVQKYNSTIRNLFEELIELGCIQEKSVDSGVSNRYECLLTEKLDLERFLSGYSMQLNADRPNFTEVKRCLQDLRRMLEQGLVIEEKKDIFGSTTKEFAVENFIRFPELTRRMREEAVKYQTVKGKIEELLKIIEGHEDEEKQLIQFIEAIYTQTIRKKGALIVYDYEGDEEPWDAFVNLMQSNKYIEYEIYSKFRQLNERKMILLQRKSSKRAQQLASSEDIQPLLKGLKEMAAGYSEAKARLEYERSEEPNGEELFRFYRSVTVKVGDLLNKLS